MNRKLIFVLVLCGLGLTAVLVHAQASPIPPLLPAQQAAVPLAALDEPEDLYFVLTRTLGTTDVPYVYDHEHFFYPMGLGTSGNQVWISEFAGQRVQKFDSDGSYAGLELGGAGISIPNSGAISDVTIDAQGNTWVVVWESGIFVFDPEGNLMTFDPPVNPLQSPRSVAFDSQGNVYVADQDNHFIAIFSDSDELLNSIGERGVNGYDNDHFNFPFRVAIDAQDRLYVADMDNHRLQIFDVTEPLTPTYQATIGVANEPGADNDHLDGPRGVAVDETYIYVADSRNNRVQIFDIETRAYVDTILSDCDGFDDDCANDVAVDADGLIYVSEPKRSIVQQYDSDLNLVRTFGVPDEPYPVDGDHFMEISGLAASPDGGLLVMAPYGNPQVYKLDAQGDLEWTLDFPEWPSYFGRFWTCMRDCPPDDVTTDSAGNVYVTFDNIRLYHPDGSYWKSIGSANNAGSGGDQFDRPDGVAVTPAGVVYVADSGNHRVQVFDQSLVYSDTLGVTGIPGSDHAHFDTPVDVVLDSAGNLYVADLGNARVEVFDPSLDYVRTIEPLQGNIDLQIAVDAQDRLYVTDENGQVLVFDPSGVFLTSLAGDFGRGLAIDQSGNLYLGRPGRNDIQVFAPGPGFSGWQQVNEDAFGDPCNQGVWAMEAFAGKLYAATRCDGGAQVWRTADGTAWNQFTAPWSISTTIGLDMQPFGAYLYLGTDGPGGAQIWRTDGLSWGLSASEGFGNPNNFDVIATAVFSDTLYAATQNEVTGLEIWRSASGNLGSWAKVFSAGADATGFGSHALMDVFQGSLYLGINRGEFMVDGNHAELWRTSDGTTWTPVFTDGLGNPNNSSLSAMAEFGGYFYIGFRNIIDGGQVWRSTNGADWVNVISGGSGNIDNTRPYGLIVYAGQLYLVYSNYVTGGEVWQTADGLTWKQIAAYGWGDMNNQNIDYVDKSAAVFGHALYIGTLNNFTGGEVWQYSLPHLFLPLIVRQVIGHK